VEDEWTNFLFNLHQSSVDKIASLEIVTLLCGDSLSQQCSIGSLYIGLLFLLFFTRKLILGLLAGLLVIALSPVLAMLFIFAKLVLFLFPPVTANNTKPKAEKFQTLIKATLIPSGSKSIYNSTSKTPSSNRSYSFVSGGRREVMRSRATSSQLKKRYSPPTISYPIQSSAVTPTPTTQRYRPSPEDSSPYVGYERVYRDNEREVSSSAPNNSELSANNEGKYGSPAHSFSPSSAAAVESLRARKSSINVTSGLTPAAALGLVPAREHGNELFPSIADERDDDQVELFM
jgi:hypothetical protein